MNLKVIISLATIFLSICTNAYAGYECSAFFVSPDGYIATAAHCSHGSTIIAVYPKNGVMVHKTVTVVSTDTVHDVALLKVTEKDMPYFTFNLVPVSGDTATLYGWPDISVYGPKLKAHPGTITSIDDDRIYLYGWVGHGMSGGAMVDHNGRAEGVIVAFAGLYDPGWGNDVVVSKIQWLNQLLLDKGVIVLPQDDSSVKDKMVFLIGD